MGIVSTESNQFKLLRNKLGKTIEDTEESKNDELDETRSEHYLMRSNSERKSMS